jgi:hypothetical protein
LKKLERILGLSEEGSEAAMPKKMSNGPKRREWKGARLMTERGCGRKFVVLNCCRSEKKVASVSPPSHSLAPPQHLGVVCACPPALDR